MVPLSLSACGPESTVAGLETQGIALLVTGMLKAFVLRQTREVPQFTTAAVNKQNQDPLTPLQVGGTLREEEDHACLSSPSPDHLTSHQDSGPLHTLA